MRQSINTKYIGPTNYRGARIKARSSSGLSVTLGWRDEENVDANHTRAAEALAAKLGWRGRWIVGAAEDGRGNVFVQDDGDGFTLA